MEFQEGPPFRVKAFHPQKQPEIVNYPLFFRLLEVGVLGGSIGVWFFLEAKIMRRGRIPSSCWRFERASLIARSTGRMPIMP